MATTRSPFRNNRPQRITRAAETVPVACDNTLADADPIDFRAASGAVLFVPAGAASGTVSLYVSDTETGTYVPLNDADGAVTVSVAESNAYDLPEAVFAAAFVKLRTESGKDFTGSLVVKG